MPLRQVGAELGVRCVLEGSVLLDPDRVRVNVQLIDAETDEHLWAERFDKARSEVLQVQDEIVARLSRSVGIQMVYREATRGRSKRDSDALDLVMRARALMSDIKRQEHAAAAIELFRQALVLCPDCVDAMIGIALARIYQVINLYRLDREGYAARRGRGADFSLVRTGLQSSGCIKGPRIAIARARRVRRGNSCH